MSLVQWLLERGLGGPSLEPQVLVLGAPGLLHLHSAHVLAFGQNREA